MDQVAKADIEIKPLGPSPAIRTMLSELLIEAVANGGSVSFMDPLPPETADKFWESALAATERGAGLFSVPMTAICWLER